MGWLTADGFEATIVGNKVVVRKPGQRELKAVPAALKKNPVVDQLRQVVAWLGDHEREIGARIEQLMIRSLPITRVELTAVWADESWRNSLIDLLVCAGLERGMLRAVEPGRGIGLVTLGGDSVWTTADVLTVPHPVLLGDDLPEFREFAADLGVTQPMAQLDRETWVLGDRNRSETTVSDFAGAEYAQLGHLTQRVAELGYEVRAGFAICPLWQEGGPIQAQVWVGDDEPFYETATGDLMFTDHGTPLALARVDAVAFSEGMRMAAALWTGRAQREAEPA